MLECIIFVLTFLFVSVAAVVCATGWLNSSERNEKLTIELYEAERDGYFLTKENKKLKAEVSFLKSLLEEKEDVQESEENINA